MDEKKLKKLEDLMKVANTDYVTSEELSQLLVSLLEILKTVQDKQASSMECAHSDMMTVEKKILSKIKEIDSRISNLPKQLSSEEVKKLAKTQVKENIANIPKITDQEIIDIVRPLISQINIPVLDTPDEVVNKVNKATAKIKKTQVEGLEEVPSKKEFEDVKRMAVASANASAMPVTTSFFNGLRGKNLKIIGGTAVSKGDTVEITTSGGTGSGQVNTVVAGTGISVNSSDPVNPIITNTAPDQTVAITAGTNITSVTGTYPNFTINAATQAGGAGDVVGPASAVDSNFVAFDTTTGKLIKDSGHKHSDYTPSVMTTLGDVIYGGTAGAATRLAGNTTNSQLFLSSTGSGGAALAPSWQTIPALGTLVYYWTNTASSISTYYLEQPSPFASVVTISNAGVTNGQLLATFATASGQPNRTFIPDGQYSCHMHLEKTTGTKTAQVYAEVWEVNSAGVDIAKIATLGPSDVISGVESEYLIAAAVLKYDLASNSSRIITKIYATITGGGAAPTLVITAGGVHDSRTNLPAPLVDITNYIPYTGATNDLVTAFNVNLSGETASTIASFDASKNIKSLALATYPSLTELSYVKGVTSAIQTQINTKGVGDMVLASAQSVTGAKTFDKDKILVKGTSTGTTNITTANTSATSYTATLPARDLTIDNLTTGSTTNLTGFIKGDGSVLSADNSTYYKSGDSPSFTTVSTTGGTASGSFYGSIQGLGNSGTFPTLGSNGLATLYGSSTLGAVLGGKGSSTDVFICNSAGSTVMSVPTGTVGASFGGTLTAAAVITAAGSFSRMLVLNNSAADAPITGQTYISFNTASSDRYYIGMSAAAIDGAFSLYNNIAAAASWSVSKTNVMTVTSPSTFSNTLTTGSTIELGHATDTTLSRVSAGVVAIEGKNILTTDGGTLTGSITLGENTGLALDPAGSADGKWSGITITGTSDYTQAFGDLVYLKASNSRWAATDADASSTGGPVMVGMVVSAGTSGNACTILLQGQIRADAKFPALTIGAPVYLGETAGEIQVAIPTGADNVIRVVGFALTADEIYFNPSQDHQLSVA